MSQQLRPTDLEIEAREYLTGLTPRGRGGARWEAVPLALETDLMRVFRDRGDLRAFELLYRLSAPDLEAWLRRRSRGLYPRFDVEEAVQDTFVNIFRYRDSFQGSGPGGFRRWARTIAANAMHRSRRTGALTWVPLANAEEPACEAADPELQSADREQSQRLAEAYSVVLAWVPAALAELSPRDRYVLLAIHVHGAAYAEIEAELGMRPGGLKMVVHRARSRFWAQLRRVAEAVRLPSSWACAQ
ncbi:MAG: RNA polymerase sigma factor [Planctomycetota bacterium]